jgi:hypothetical protein
MKTFTSSAAQGEISIRIVKSMPNDVTPLSPENGKLVIGHSETGHHHVLERPAPVFVSKTAPDGMRVLYMLLDEPNALIHDRPFDTHEAIALNATADGAIAEFRIGREFDPYAEVARQQAD